MQVPANTAVVARANVTTEAMVKVRERVSHGAFSGSHVKSPKNKVAFEIHSPLPFSREQTQSIPSNRSASHVSAASGSPSTASLRLTRARGVTVSLLRCAACILSVHVSAVAPFVEPRDSSQISAPSSNPKPQAGSNARAAPPVSHSTHLARPHTHPPSLSLLSRSHATGVGLVRSHGKAVKP